MTTTTADREPLPSPALPRRLLAIVYDLLLVIPLLMVSTAASLALARAIGLLDAESALPPAAVWLLAVLCCCGFFSAFWLRGGQTLGMQAWRIRLVDSRGGQLRPGRVLLRCVAAALSIACLGLGYLWQLFDRDSRSWHDRLSHTHLELLPKRARRG